MAVMPERVLEALRRGDTLEAIKRLRAVTPLGLKEAKDVIDAYRRGDMPMPSRPAPSVVHAPPTGHADGAAARADAAKSASTERLRQASGYGLAQARDASDASRYRDHPTGVGGRSPGEMPNSGRWIRWLVVVAMAAYAAYLAVGRWATV